MTPWQTEEIFLRAAQLQLQHMPMLALITSNVVKTSKQVYIDVNTC